MEIIATGYHPFCSAISRCNGMRPLIFNELHLGSFFFQHFIAFNCIGMRSFSSYFNDVVQWLCKNYKLMNI